MKENRALTIPGGKPCRLGTAFGGQTNRAGEPSRFARFSRSKERGASPTTLKLDAFLTEIDRPRDRFFDRGTRTLQPRRGNERLAWKVEDCRLYNKYDFYVISTCVMLSSWDGTQPVEAQDFFS